MLPRKAMGDGSGLSHVKQGFDAIRPFRPKPRTHSVTSLLYGATLYYLNLDQKSTLSSFAIATSD